MTYYFEIKNVKTLEQMQVYATCMREAAKKAGWPVKLTKCVYKAIA